MCRAGYYFINTPQITRHGEQQLLRKHSQYVRLIAKGQGEDVDIISCSPYCVWLVNSHDRHKNAHKLELQGAFPAVRYVHQTKSSIRAILVTMLET